MYYDDISNWCAVTHVYYVAAENSINQILSTPYKKESWNNSGASVVMVTVNEDEHELIKKLKEAKFKKGPWLKNWAHGGRRTCAYFKQLSLEEWKTKTGMKLGEYDDPTEEDEYV